MIYDKIDLITNNGEAVQTVSIPLFRPRPDVLTWGVRTFVYDNDLSTAKQSVYRECFNYSVVPIMGLDNNGFNVK